MGPRVASTKLIPGDPPEEASMRAKVVRRAVAQGMREVSSLGRGG